MIEHLKKSKGGFTLVELIVVIAILAILSGIAVPVYSGYISKANEAGDLQLLGALNTAYTAACAEMGLDPTKVVGLATLSGEAGSKKVSNVTASGSGAVALSGSSEEFFDAFKRYYGDNINTPFKVYESLGYDMANGVFVDGAKEYTFATANGTVTVTAAQLSAYLGSSFDKMGAAGISGKIDALVNQAMGAITEGSGQALFASPDFQAFLTERGITLDPADPNYDRKAANALVLYTATHAEGTDVQSWLSALQNGDPLATQGRTGADIILPMAAEYAMLVAYCSDPNGLISTTTYTPGETVVGNKNSENWSDYLAYATQNGSFDKELAKEWVAQQYGEDIIIGSCSKLGFRFEYPGETVTTTVNASEWFTEQTQNMTTMFDIIGLHNAYDQNGQPIEITGMWETFSQCDEFQSYVQNQAEYDLNAFLNALQMVDANTGNVDINSVLENGWQNGGIADIIAAVTGNP